VKKKVTLQSVIESMAQLLRTSVSKKAVVTFEFASGVHPVHADVSQVRQILMNLVVNGSEAISGKPGAIIIRTGKCVCTRDDLDRIWLGQDLPGGAYAYMEVADTGSGMETDIVTRVFDPFFTTKFTGRGLGLAAVLGIVRGHQGAIDLRSEPGKGTTFRVLFPIAEGQAPSETAEAGKRPQGTFAGRTVLLIDDEEVVRAVGRRVLERLGANVVTAEDGRQALRLFAAEPGKFDCVLLDLTMPFLNGEEVLPELKRIRNDVCVVLSSGYSEQELIGRFHGKGVAGFVKKPYETEKLREVLLSAMGGAQASMI
jgi:CheY-like chemotaxis protein